MSVNFRQQIFIGLLFWTLHSEITAHASTSEVADSCEPRIATVVVGSHVLFSCCASYCTAKSIRWMRIVGQVEVIYSPSGGFDNEYDGIISIDYPDGGDAEGGRSVLSIKSASYNNAGRYQCQCYDSNDDEINCNMELVVMGAMKDSCNVTQSVLEYEIFKVQCFLNLSARSTISVTPSINCSSEITRTSTTTFRNAYKNETQSLSYIGSFTAVVNQQVTCHLLVNYSEQQPLLISEWSTVPNVLFAVRDVSIRPTSNETVTVVNHGEKFNCEARGNPNPVYYWLDPSTGRRTEGQQYVVDWCNVNNTLITAPKTLLCVAKNDVIGNFSQVNVSVTFSSPAEADLELACPGKQAVLLTTVVCAVLAAVAILSVSILCLKRKGCSQQRQRLPSGDVKHKSRPQRVIREAAFVPATNTERAEALNQPKVGGRGRHGLQTRLPHSASTNNVADDTASSRRHRDNNTLPAVYMQYPEYSDIASVTPPIGSPPARPPRTPAMSGRMLPRLPGTAAAAMDESSVYADVSVVHEETGTSRQREAAAARIRGVQVEPSLYAAIDHTTGSLNFKNFI